MTIFRSDGFGKKSYRIGRKIHRGGAKRAEKIPDFSRIPERGILEKSSLTNAGVICILSYRAIAKNMFRLSKACFSQHNTVLRECALIDARRRDRYRYRNRDRPVIFEVDTDSEPDTDSDDSGALAFVYRLSIGKEF